MCITNKQRAARVSRILRANRTDETAIECLIDLLADARHWCDRHSQCYGDLDRLAHRHYLAELAEERGAAL